ncbi:alpha/beta hydrolase fold-containing protein [Caldalkalibacillus thermarum TA2.A1]|uniref:Alpha/beta hydrolase fold-containing protein n=1 Tax=Caldalkalibacillus thermarum (strain TA2.A1) TaxID=986075 RepID=F5L6M6_CALTT|nr:alpha/beta fold hydrolase [Caldalkalibacillus thermarum]EGL83033.1 alpha/beta hydrolase fold-containing protein [Caldalkalibacillus thermarum TA2.A1]QZT32495.1 lysophospholipase [Caldalkalibacillus thermarum TA2.A1]
MGRKRRWLLWGSVGVVVLALLIIVGISVYVGWQLVHPEKKPLDEWPEDYGLTFEEFEVESLLDGIRLKGWIMETPGPAQGVLVFAHGYSGNRLEKPLPALALARDLVESGFHVVMFDFRNSGESEGNMTTVGLYEKDDLISVVQSMKVRYLDLPLGVIGFSMGAATALQAAAEEPLIEAVVADSPFRDLKAYLAENLSHWSGLPDFPFTPVILGILPRLIGIDPAEVSPLRAIEEIEVPVLLIHGTGDEAIPYSNSEAIYANGHPDDVQLWIAEGAGHVRTYNVYPEEYKTRVVHFFQEAFQNE